MQRLETDVMWHGLAHCGKRGCDWTFDMKGEAARAIGNDLAARKHEKAEGHGTTVSLHRTDYCAVLHPEVTS